MQRAAARLAHGRRRSRLPVLIALTDHERAADPAAALNALPRGTALIWRCYGVLPGRTRVSELSRIARARGILLLIAGDGRAALRVGVEGLHFPERSLRGGLGVNHGRLLLTAAAHSEAAIIRAARARIDAVLISPVFTTKSHPGAPALGVVRFARLSRLATSLGLGVIALGGVVDATALRRLTNTGAQGVAGIGFLSQA
jgi:thiamine-phosphate pyrophosphorylase